MIMHVKTRRRRGNLILLICRRELHGYAEDKVLILLQKLDVFVFEVFFVVFVVVLGVFGCVFFLKLWLHFSTGKEHILSSAGCGL